MPTARVNGIDIWYERSGGPGPLVVLTHGFAGPTAGWPPIIDEFRARFDLLLYDVRAHGRTTVPDDPSTVTVPQFAADLAGLLDALGIERGARRRRVDGRHDQRAVRVRLPRTSCAR